MAQSLISLIITQLMDVFFFQEHNNIQLMVKSHDIRDSIFLTIFVIFDFQVKILNISWIAEIFQVVGHVLLDYSWLSFDFFSRYQFDRKYSQFESFTFSWWGREQTLLRFIVFFTFYFRTFPYWTFVSFTNWLIRYDSELKIEFITRIVSSFLLDYFFLFFASYERYRSSLSLL